MNDFIFNVLPAQGPTIPQWFPIVGGMPASTFAGAFFGVLFGFGVNWIWQAWSIKRLIFEEEYYIKAELEGIEHDVDPELGGRPHPIKPIYGADHIRKYRLFGEYRTQVIYWYEGFEKYNSRLEDLWQQHRGANNSEERQAIADAFWTLRNSQHNLMGGILRSGWLKKIPESTNNSGLSLTKFVWYLLNQDALEEPTRKGDFSKAALNKLLRKGPSRKLH
ncbi:MAG: hypothetical protein WBL87_09335 [Methanothrix sp.]